MGDQHRNWEHLNEQITKSPFDPYCDYNVNVLVQEWYKWINKILEANIPKVTRHRASLPPWVTPSTSHLIKKLGTKQKRWKIMNLSRSLKKKKLEKQISIHAEMAAVEEMLDFLNIEDKKLSKIHRIGRYDSAKTVSRTLLIHLENPISKDLVLKSAYRLKDFNKQVFVSPELSPVDAKKENECLKIRRKLIDENKFDRKEIRIRNLTVEVKVNGAWVTNTDSNSNTEDSSSEDEDGS